MMVIKHGNLDVESSLNLLWELFKVLARKIVI